MNRLDPKTRAQVIHCLVEGNSIRATCRLTGAAKGTVLKLLADIGAACIDFHDEHVRGVKAQRVQCDEIWSFVAAKDKNLTPEQKMSGMGSMWTWTAIDADSKLVISYLVGGRDAGYAYEFMNDVADRLVNRVQLTTDAHKTYLAAVADAFGNNIDYAQLVKIYGPCDTIPGRYSPAECTGVELRPIVGAPELEHVSTSFVERQNLTMRMSMRRFTRLTNGFSKKAENLAYAVGLHFMYYNYCRVHQSLKVTPAMAAGLTDHIWSIADLVDLIPEPEVAAWGSKSGRKAATLVEI